MAAQIGGVVLQHFLGAFDIAFVAQLNRPLAVLRRDLLSHLAHHGFIEARFSLFLIGCDLGAHAGLRCGLGIGVEIEILHLDVSDAHITGCGTRWHAGLNDHVTLVVRLHLRHLEGDAVARDFRLAAQNALGLEALLELDVDDNITRRNRQRVAELFVEDGSKLAWAFNKGMIAVAGGSQALHQIFIVVEPEANCGDGDALAGEFTAKRSHFRRR